MSSPTNQTFATLVYNNPTETVLRKGASVTWLGHATVLIAPEPVDLPKNKPAAPNPGRLVITSTPANGSP